MKKCVLSVSNLYKNFGSSLVYGDIKHFDENGSEYESDQDKKEQEDTENNIGYFDYYDRENGLCCMDGETCEIILETNDNVTLLNKEAETDKQFIITKKEFEVGCVIY